MSDLLVCTQSGLTVHFVYLSPSGQVWNLNASAWESWTDANYNAGYYSAVAAELGTSAAYSAATPSGVGDSYVFIARSYVDGTIADDTILGAGSADPAPSAGASSGTSKSQGLFAA